jgi:hypothetical protein
MKRVRFLIPLVAIALGILIARPGFAADPAKPAGDAKSRSQQAQDHSEVQQQTAHQDHSSAAKSTDPNYRWHNGRWWYWQNSGWLMWNGDRWLNQQERARVYSYRPQRSFSYTEDQTATNRGYLPTYAGIPRSDASGLQRSTVAPGTVEYQRVVPSYGLRSAGSKALGNY